MSFKIGQVASPAVRAPFAPIKSRAHLCSIPTVDIIRSPVRVIGKRPKMSDIGPYGNLPKTDWTKAAATLARRYRVRSKTKRTSRAI